MLSHWTGLLPAQAVIKPLVVGVVKSLLLQRPFQIPVNFRHEYKVGMLVPDLLGGLGPKWFGFNAPGPLKNFR